MIKNKNIILACVLVVLSSFVFFKKTDGHTAALDPVSCEKVLELTKLIAQKPGMITLMISHNLSFIEKLRTKVLKIQGGKASISSPFGENKEL